MTLVEILIGIALLVGVGSVLLSGMHYSMAHAEYLGQFQIAMNAVQGELELLTSTPFNTLATGGAFIPARPPNTGLRVCLGEDVNCNGVLDPGEDVDPDGPGPLLPNGVLDPGPWSGGSLAVQIRNPDGTAPTAASTLLDVHVAACWSARGRRLGEDQNCNGQLDAGEDSNGNGWIDAPAMVSTRIAR